MDTITDALKTIVVPTIITGTSELIRKHKLKNVQVLKTGNNNPYTGQIKGSTAADKELYSSYLGTPVLTDLTLGIHLSGTLSPKLSPTNSGLYFNGSVIGYPDAQGNYKQYKVMTFTTVLITVDQTKNIVRTQIQGMDGAVKEYIGMDDYIITINGIIPAPNNHYPAEAVRDLNNLCSAPVALPVVSTYLQNLDIDYIVINRFTLNQEEGHYAQQAFTINAYSAKEVDLVITTGKTCNISAQ